MSQAPMAVGIAQRYENGSADVTVIDTERERQLVLEALTDIGCRNILDATSGAALSAKELSNECALPLSTTYRKLDMLTEAGLLDERVRVRQAGKHPSEYSRSVENVLVSVDESGEMTLQVAH